MAEVENSSYAGGVTHWVLWAVPHPLTLAATPRDFEAEVFIGWIPFILSNQQIKALV